MTFCTKSLKSFGIINIVTIVVLLAMVTSSQAQLPDIVVKVGDTTANPGTQNTVISVYLDNLVDTIAGYNLLLELDRPDIMVFQTDTVTVYDTTYWYCDQWNGPDCLDSHVVFEDSADFFYVDIYLDTIGNFDSTGTLCSGWELVDARPLSSLGTNINVAGIANFPGDNDTTTGIPPGQQGGVLIKILADVFDIPDSMTERTVNIMIQTDFKDHFGLSRPDGSSIPWIPVEIEDTSCFRCDQWIINGDGDTICANYTEITFGECDSIDITLDTIQVLDTANVKVFDGSLTVMVPPPYICGNIDGSDPPVIDIADLVYLVDYMFGTPPGPPPVPLEAANMDCQGGVDIADLVIMVDYMFGSGVGFCEGCSY